MGHTLYFIMRYCKKATVLKSLAEFAPAGAKKVKSFLAAACTSPKILCAEGTCEAPAIGRGFVR